MGKIYDIETVKDLEAVNLAEAVEKDGVITVPESAACLTVSGGRVEGVEDEEK